MQQMQEGVENPVPKVLFEVGEVVPVSRKVRSPISTVRWKTSITKNRLRVSVTIFGRATPVELEFARSKRP